MSARNAEAKEVQELRPGATLGPGEYIFFVRDNGVKAGINFGCPCGCGQVGGIDFKEANQGQGWEVTGEWPNTSATPSIGFYGSNKREQGFHWHGYLRNGVFEEC
jgi:hypothetical protein